MVTGWCQAKLFAQTARSKHRKIAIQQCICCVRI